MGFKEPNYTQTPNELFDECMRKMGEAELRVTLAVIRKTMGYHKDRDAISYSQIMEMTGLSRSSTQDGINKAVEHGFIEIAGNGKRGVNIFRLVVNPDQSGKATSTGSVGLPVTGSVTLPTKETPKETPKETSKETKSADAHSQSPAQPGNSNTIQGIPPSPKRKPVRSEKSPTTREGWLAKLQPVYSVVVEMLRVCYDGWDTDMMTPEHSLTVQQLQKYITNAYEYARLGGASDEVKCVYEFIGDVDYTIAPQTIAGHYLRWKASQRPDKPVAATKTVEPPKVVMTEVERAARLEQMKADKAALFG